MFIITQRALSGGLLQRHTCTSIKLLLIPLLILSFSAYLQFFTVWLTPSLLVCLKDRKQMLCFLAFTAPCPDINKTAKCKHVHVLESTILL